VVTVVEEPVPPVSRSAPKRTLILVLSLVLGGFLGIGGAFVRAFFNNAQENTEEQEKFDEIRKHLIPARWQVEQSGKEVSSP
jgi:LPS O-antigen subunit length determinant protein (WzzB/FepE family)